MKQTALLEAIGRLQNGNALNESVAKKIKRGTFRFSVTDVSLEAKVSRTLIAHKNCAYPEIRLMVLGLQKPINDIRTEANLRIEIEKQIQSYVDSIKARELTYQEILKRGGKFGVYFDNFVRDRFGPAGENYEQNQTYGASKGANFLRLKERLAMLKLYRQRQDTVYATLLVTMMEYRKGNHPDATPIQPSTLKERIASLYIASPTES